MKKTNYYIIFIGCVLIVIPFYLFISVLNGVLDHYIPVIIGLVLLLIQYRAYDYKQKKLVNILIIFVGVSIALHFWEEPHFRTFNEITFKDIYEIIMVPLLYVISSIGQRILGIVIGFEILRNKKNK